MGNGNSVMKGLTFWLVGRWGIPFWSNSNWIEVRTAYVYGWCGALGEKVTTNPTGR